MHIELPDVVVSCNKWWTEDTAIFEHPGRSRGFKERNEITQRTGTS